MVVITSGMRRELFLIGYFFRKKFLSFFIISTFSLGCSSGYESKIQSSTGVKENSSVLEDDLLKSVDQASQVGKAKWKVVSRNKDKTGDLDSDQQLSLSGIELYVKNCSVCHGPIVSTPKRGFKKEQIKASIAHVPEMKHLSRLTDESIALIARALNDDKSICVPVEEPLRTSLARLNAEEYNHTVRDLLRDTSRPAQNFSPGSRGKIFSNIATNLTVSPNGFLELYSAAGDLATEFVRLDNTLKAIWQIYLPCNINQALSPQCIEGFVEKFGLRAYRRPLTKVDKDHFATLVRELKANGESGKDLLTGILEAFLISPNFLFKVIDKTNSDLNLNSYELATRLSYFLWQSTPDQTLLDAAANGDLLDKQKRAKVVEGMMASQKFSESFENFVTDWLMLWGLEERADEIVRASSIEAQTLSDMRRETMDFVKYHLFEEKPLSELLTAEYTFASENLAQYYGLASQRDAKSSRLSLAGTPRIGVATHASILVLTSEIAKTTPTKRGKWMLDRLLCKAPPDPEAVVPFEERDLMGKSVKEKMAIHRQNPSCAGCHEYMDPVGLGLEAFDQFGQVRGRYSDGRVVETAAKWPDGSSYTGAREMISIWNRHDYLSECLAGHVLTYSTGTELGAKNTCQVEHLRKLTASKGQLTLKSIMTQITESPQFLQTLK